MATEVENSEEKKELTPEQKELQEKIMRGVVVSKFKTSLQDINFYMKKYKISLEEVKKEIDDKTSKLTKSRRDFVIGFKIEFIQQLLDDMYKPKA